MSADDLIRWLAQGSFVAIFLIVAARAARRPSRVNLDVLAFFGAITAVIALPHALRPLGLAQAEFAPILIALFVTTPFLFLRILDNIVDVPGWTLWAAFVATVVLVLSYVLLSVSDAFVLLEDLLVGVRGLDAQDLLFEISAVYVLLATAYATVWTVRGALRARGVTSRRLHAVALGILLLGGAFVIPALVTPLRLDPAVMQSIARVVSVASAVAFVLGFIPPRLLRRAWQEPELRRFLARAAELPRLGDTKAIVRELERGAADSTGARASIGLWDETRGVLAFWRTDAPELFDVEPGQMIAGRAFAGQRAVVSEDARRDDPEHAEVYRSTGATAVIAAPITAGERRLGVLAAFASRAPVFADDDLELVRLLADQAAVILESRALIDEAVRVRALEEAARLKDDFLSAAAHDLRTPLTAVVMQAQLLERRSRTEPEAPADAAGIRRLVADSRRLSVLLDQLLDASRAERGVLVGHRQRISLDELVREVCERRSWRPHNLELISEAGLIGDYDPARITQLMENLLENAVKYSPEGETIRVRLWREDAAARVSVRDEGIGIPAADLEHVFERFHRGSNVDDRRFTGTGLGLFICRAIAEQHGGRIWAESEGPGSTFHVLLPLAPVETTVAS